MSPRRFALPALLVAVLPLGACSLTESNAKPKDGNKVTVVSHDSSCDLSTDTAPSGNVVFSISNKGSKVTEFYLYAADNKRIVGEVENIGPGIKRDLVVSVTPGTYHPACKPGMTGKGIRSDFTVTKAAGGSAATGIDQTAIHQATSQYASFVEEETEELVAKTRAFTAAYGDGDDARARALYPRARTHWERIEPVAESFGDLDPLTDLREADLEPGQKWTGWHRIEKDLWPPATGYRALTPAQRASYAADLMKNITTLETRVEDLDVTVDQIGNGSKSLLDEVATGKITGEEDIWSHTDLYDFQANVDGARVGFEGLEPMLQTKNPALAATVKTRFAALQKLLDRHRDGAGFVSYETVTPAQRKQLSDAVNALSEPLSTVTAAITL